MIQIGKSLSALVTDINTEFTSTKTELRAYVDSMASELSLDYLVVTSLPTADSTTYINNSRTVYLVRNTVGRAVEPVRNGGTFVTQGEYDLSEWFPTEEGGEQPTQSDTTGENVSLRSVQPLEDDGEGEILFDAGTIIKPEDPDYIEPQFENELPMVRLTPLRASPAAESTGSDYYLEYICIRLGDSPNYTYQWEKIGDTDIDLSQYARLDEDNAYAGKQTIQLAGSNYNVETNGEYISFGRATAGNGVINRTTTILGPDYSAAASSNEIRLPTGSGTIALTSQIPTVNNGTLTVKVHNTSVGTFSANQSSNANINIPAGDTSTYGVYNSMDSVDDVDYIIEDDISLVTNQEEFMNRMDNCASDIVTDWDVFDDTPKEEQR